MTTELLQEKLNKKADDKLKIDVDALFNINYSKNKSFDFQNNYLPVSVIDELVSKCNEVKFTWIIDAIKHQFIKQYQENYRINETNDFLKKVESIEEDLNDLRNNLNL